MSDLPLAGLMRSLLLAMLLVLTVSWPAEAEAGLVERNRAFLLATLPADSVIEVRVLDGSEERVEVWTTEAYAAFRAVSAARMGRDYAAAGDGVPFGAGDGQEAFEIYMDLWGTTRVNVATERRCVPATIHADKMWISSGPCFVAENDNVCVQGVCSFSYYWTMTQDGTTHGDSWFAGIGQMYIFPAPFGALAAIEGVEFREDL